MTNPCATGCVSLGSHKATCDGLNAASAECRGCTPREAVQGVLCGRCWGNLQRDVRTAPSIVDWIREHVIPSGQQALMQESTVKIRGPRTDSEGAFYIGLASPTRGSEGFEPLSASAVDDADELHASLASWALLLLEEHPSGLHLKIPGSRKTHTTHREVREGSWLAWCDRCGRVGASDLEANVREMLQSHSHAATEIRPNLRPWVEVQRLPVVQAGMMPDSDATTSVCKFLATHLEWAAEQEWAGEMVTEVGTMVRTFLARYPQAERSRYLSEVRCPACERTSMVYTPPAWAGQAFLVQCDHQACGCIVPESHFGLFMAMVLEDRKREMGQSA